MTITVLIVVSVIFFFALNEAYRRLTNDVQDIRDNIEELKKIVTYSKKDENSSFGTIDPVTGFPRGFLSTEEDEPKTEHSPFRERYGHLLES